MCDRWFLDRPIEVLGKQGGAGTSHPVPREPTGRVYTVSVAFYDGSMYVVLVLVLVVSQVMVG